MKGIKGLILFGFLAFLSSCFEPPEYENSPVATFNSIEFKVTPELADADSLIIYVDFRDGDGDMGLDDSYRSDPYHERNFFYEDLGSENNIKAVGTILQAVNRPPYPTTIPMIVTPPTGKLVTNRTRNKPGFETLPPFSSATVDCQDYTIQYLLIAPAAKNSIDETYAIIDTLRDQSQNEYYLLNDTTYFETNLNHYNILVRFFESNGGPYTEFSWEEELCSTFNGRYPILTDKTNTPLEGTIRYSMVSAGFIPLFSIKNLKLEVTVKDRAFNQSTFTTPEFTLDKIRVN
jgi:hypothetical protein